MVDEIAFTMKSCFAGVYLDGFDFIQGTPWISSERSEDFIAAVQRFHETNRKRDNISATNRFVISFCCYKGLGLAHKAFDRSNAMLALHVIFQFLQ